MTRKSLLLPLAFGLACPTLALAQVGVYVGGGTTGVGGGLAVTASPSIDIRAEYLGGRSNSDTRTDGNDYKTQLRFSNPGVVADYYLGGRFHLSGGLYFSDNKIKVEGRPSSTGTYTINNRTYSANNASLTGETELRKGVAPYFGVGWGTRPSTGRGIGWRVEIGALYMTPKTKLSSTGLTGATLAQDLANEEQKINDKQDRYRIYPAASAHFSWNF
jgi:hypothetical protein